MTDPDYSPPTLEAIGTLHELTLQMAGKAAGGLDFFGDNGDFISPTSA